MVNFGSQAISVNLSKFNTSVLGFSTGENILFMSVHNPSRDALPRSVRRYEARNREDKLLIICTFLLIT